MNTFTLTCHKKISTLVIDTILIGLALLVPTISHLTALPLSNLNPMLLVILTGMIFVDQRSNSILLAIALPFISYWIIGTPTAAKALCMAAEFLTLVMLFPLIRSKQTTLFNQTYSIALSMLCAKGVYYLLKSILIGGTLINTPIPTQIFTCVGYSLLFALISGATNRS